MATLPITGIAFQFDAAIVVRKHEFGEFIPDELDQGTIYISIRFATSSHLCICGCGARLQRLSAPRIGNLYLMGRRFRWTPRRLEIRMQLSQYRRTVGESYVRLGKESWHESDTISTVLLTNLF